MATSSISGLASGLDTATIISQLMQLEAAPQTRLKNQQSTEKAAQTAYRGLNTDVTKLRDAAESLAKASTWQTVQGTVTGTGASAMTVKVTGTAAPNSLTVTVDKVAAKHELAFTDAAAMSDVVVTGAGVKLTTNDGTVFNLDTGGGTLTELVAAINDATDSTGVSATAVKVANGSYRLLVQSTTTGADTSFTLTNDDDSPLLGGATVTAGSDAQITLGSGITATSTTNTFTALVPGVDLTLDPTASIGSKATVTLAQSSSGIADSVKALVTQMNSILTNIDALTAHKTTTTAAGTLDGDPVARTLRNQLLETVFGQSGTTLADVGIQTDRYGKLVWNADKFNDAYAADPAAVAAKFTTGATTADDGFAARVAKVADGAVDFVDGSLTQAIAREDATIARYTQSIADWDERLALRQSTLEKTYTALETALSNMQSQSSWLTSAIASLPTYS